MDMFMLFLYTVLVICTAIYAKIMYSQSFWLYFYLSFLFTPMYSFCDLFNKPPLRIWYRTKLKPKEEVKPYTRTSSTAPGIYTKNERPPYTEYVSPSRSSQSSRNDISGTDHITNVALYSSVIDIPDNSTSRSSYASSSTCSRSDDSPSWSSGSDSSRSSSSGGGGCD